jgi:hypothetical protein
MRIAQIYTASTVVSDQAGDPCFKQFDRAHVKLFRKNSRCLSASGQSGEQPPPGRGFVESRQAPKPAVAGTPNSCLLAKLPRMPLRDRAHLLYEKLNRTDGSI